jgi:hypothetical protein
VKLISLREVHGSKVSENGILRIYVPNREELTIGWKKLHVYELHNLMLLGSQS